MRKCHGKPASVGRALSRSSYLKLVLAVGLGVRVPDILLDNLEHFRVTLEWRHVRVELFVVHIDWVLFRFFLARLARSGEVCEE